MINFDHFLEDFAGLYNENVFYKFNVVTQVFKRSATASRSTKNYQLSLRTSGVTSKSVQSVFQEKLKMNMVFRQKLEMRHKTL